MAAGLWRELREESGLEPPALKLIGKLAEEPELEGEQVRHDYLLEISGPVGASWQRTVAGTLNIKTELSIGRDP